MAGRAGRPHLNRDRGLTAPSTANGAGSRPTPTPTKHERGPNPHGQPTPPGGQEATHRAADRVVTAAEWSAAVIARGLAVGPLPRFGSSEWAALPTTDPRFIASVALAAECWSDHCSPGRIRQQLRDELTAERQLDNALRDDLFRAAAARVRHLSMVPTQAELRARRQAVAS